MRIEASSRVQLGSVPVSTKVLPASVVSRHGLGHRMHALRLELFDDIAVVLFGEEAADGARHHRPHVRHGRQRVLVGVHDGLDTAEVARHVARAVVSPTWRMPSANSRRPSAGARALSIASTRLSADFWPMRSRPTSSSGRRLYRSASDFTRPLSTSWSTSFRPALRYPAPAAGGVPQRLLALRAAEQAAGATAMVCPPAARWPSRRPDRRWA